VTKGDDREGQERADIKGGGAINRKLFHLEHTRKMQMSESAFDFGRRHCMAAAGLLFGFLLDPACGRRAAALSDCSLVRGSSPPALIPSECPSPSLSFEPGKVDLLHSESYKSE
jgi:hypothetical protein